MRIAVFGGSFDPIHNGHIALSQAFAEMLTLDRILVMPAYVSPFKQTKTGMARPEQRLEMCRLAVQDQPRTEVCDMELRREGPSYTAETLRALSEQYPHSELFLITGADAFMTLQDWKDPPTIFRLATLCTVPRRGVTVERLEQHAAVLQSFGAKTVVADIHVLTVSSTEIRACIRSGVPLTGLVPAAVEQYIRDNELYLA